MGSEWLCYQAVEQLGIRKFLEKEGWRKEEIDIALIHLISKAVYPASEHKTAQWIQDNSSVAELFSVEFGRSKEKRKDARLIALALVTNADPLPVKNLCYPKIKNKIVTC